MITYRPARFSDIPSITEFVDDCHTAGDFFVTPSRHFKYLKYYSVLLAFDNNTIIGWAVKQKNGTLIHLLIHPGFRGQGIGGTMLRILNPPKVRSKSDQSTGNPIGFYLKQGYIITQLSQGKNANIDILKKAESSTDSARARARLLS